MFYSYMCLVVIMLESTEHFHIAENCISAAIDISHLFCHPIKDGFFSFKFTVLAGKGDIFRVSKKRPWSFLLFSTGQTINVKVLSVAKYVHPGYEFGKWNN